MSNGGRHIKIVKRMRGKLRTAPYVAALTLFIAAPGFADQFKLTGVTGGTMGGVYTSPYIAQVDLKTEFVICDDFLHDSFIGQSFTATATNVSTLNGTTAVKWDQNQPALQQNDYATAAYLAEEIIQEQGKASPNTTLLGYYSFALWNVFDPALLPASNPVNGPCTLAYGCLTPTQYANAESYYNDAVAHHLSYTSYSDVWIYTPTPNQNVSQEFLYVDRVPEASGLYLLGIAFLSMVGVAFRQKRTAAAAGIR